MCLKNSPKSPWTLLEVMIVVATIGVLLAVASLVIPPLVAAWNNAQRHDRIPIGQGQSCISSLQTIAGLKIQWALDLKKSDTDVPTDDDLFGDSKYMDIKPSCPAGGTYDLKSVGEKPTCSVPSHSL